MSSGCYLPSAQNDPHGNVEPLGVTCSTLLSPIIEESPRRVLVQKLRWHTASSHCSSPDEKSVQLLSGSGDVGGLLYCTSKTKTKPKTLNPTLDQNPGLSSKACQSKAFLEVLKPPSEGVGAGLARTACLRSSVKALMT